MPDYQIITDGSCDLGTKIAEEHQIQVVPFYVSFDGETYQKEIEEMMRKMNLVAEDIKGIKVDEVF